MSTDNQPQPHGRGGLIGLALINLTALVVIGGDVVSIAAWKTATAGSYTVAEAAYLGSLWTKALFYVVLLLVFDIFCLGVGVCLRISHLHRAVLWKSEPQSFVGTHQGPPPAGRLTHLS